MRLRITILSLGVAVFFVPLQARAQLREAATPRTSSSIPVARGSGLAAPTRQVQVFAAERISDEQLRQGLSSLGLSTSAAAGTWRFTALHPTAGAGRFLELYHVAYFQPPKPYTTMTGNGQVLVYFTPINASDKYLINCTVSDNVSYRMSLPGGVTTTFSGTASLTAVWVPGSTTVSSFFFSAIDAPAGWQFYGCDLSLLQ